MLYSTFLKKQATAFVEVYQKYFTKTIKQAFLWTVLCFLVGWIISQFSNYNLISRTYPVSMLSFFVLRFSYKEAYSAVDNIKTVFIFFVAIFSINLIGKVTIKSILYLLLILFTCFLLDFSLFRLGEQLKEGTTNPHLVRWTSEVIFHLRIYIPLILFALIIQICTSKVKFTFRRLVFLLISVWFFNEVAYEIIELVRNCVFLLVLFPADTESSFYIAESILGCGLISLFFPGYYCAMTVPFSLMEDN